MGYMKSRLIEHEQAVYESSAEICAAQMNEVEAIEQACKEECRCMGLGLEKDSICDACRVLSRYYQLRQQGETK